MSLEYNVSGDPNGLTVATPNAGFEYDSAGNRTRMTDGMGEVNYVFNNLSQMTSETRSFVIDQATHTYTLNYEYNLAGELKKITNSWSAAQVTYGYDKAGRLSNVGGSGYAGVTNYADSFSYRAFGAIKGMRYGDAPNGQGHILSTAYDNRLRPTTWNVANVLGYNYGYDGYYHENTGRVVYAQNISNGGGPTNGGADGTLDRSYEYDYVGRLAVSHSGAEARAHVLPGNPWGTLDGPYSQGYDYDAWGNVTHRYGWGGEEQGGGAGQSSDITYYYTGNRRNGFTYDAAGNVKNDGTQTYTYDATGQQTSATWSAGSYTPSFTNDPLNPPNQPKTDIKLVHLTELRLEVNKLRARAGLAAVTNWNPDPSPQVNVTYVHHSHITQLRTKLKEAYDALHLTIGTYTHSVINTDDPIYAIDFQELRDKLKAAWTALSTSSTLTQAYDGNGLRVKKNEYGWTTYYLRSTVLSGQVVAELDPSGNGTRGFVYAGSSLLAVQQNGVFWMYEDPVTKSKRVTDVNGNVVSSIELDPWGADTNRSWSQAFQPRKYTSYERDGNGGDDAMFRRYNRKHARFDQPDPYDGSYDLGDPQSFNRYGYVGNDPVSFVDPSGLMMNVGACYVDGMPVNCGMAFGLVHMGAGYVRGGDGFYLDGQVLVTHYRAIADGVSWQRLYFFINAQDPKDPYNMRNILAEAKERIRKEELVKKAQQEFQNCLNNNPAYVASVKKTNEDFNDFARHAIVPVPYLGIGRVTFNKIYSGTPITSLASKQILARGAVFSLLLHSIWADAILRQGEKEQKPMKDECRKKIEAKFGFRI